MGELSAVRLIAFGVVGVVVLILDIVQLALILAGVKLPLVVPCALFILDVVYFVLAAGLALASWRTPDVQPMSRVVEGMGGSARARR